MSNCSSLRLSALSLVTAAAVSLASLVLSGCGTGFSAGSSSAAPAVQAYVTMGIQGRAMGGSTAITGATVNLWETDPGSTGYPSAIKATNGTQGAKILSTTTTATGSAVGTCASSPCTDSVTGDYITNNLATFTTSAATTLVTGEQVTLSNFTTNTFFNGLTLTVASATSTGFSATIYHANVGSSAAPVTETGTATEVPTNPAAGSFFLPGGYQCDSPTGTTSTGVTTAGPFLYITVAGGNTGSNAVNNDTVLVSALGSCSYLTQTSVISNLHVAVNEATTVAAAYALGDFIYVDDTTPGSQNVYIGAPANNNASTGSCTGTGASMVCSAAGLKHAFYNAYNLVLPYSTGTATAGFPNTSIPANPDAGTAANASAVVPAAAIDTLANLMATCVNSAGTTCTSLFNASPTPAGTGPKDTLTSAINIAQNPNHNVSTLYPLVTTTGPYQSALSAQPHDFTLAIYYPSPYNGAATADTLSITNVAVTPGTSTGTIVATASNSSSVVQGDVVTLTGFTGSPYSNLNNQYVNVQSSTSTTFTGTLSSYNTAITSSAATGTGTVAAAAGQPQAVALDANDNVYASITTSDQLGGVVSYTSNGAQNWLTSPTTAACGGFNIATDTTGLVWVANYVSNANGICGGANPGLFGFKQTNGALTQSLTSSSLANVQSAPQALAVDMSNNLWYGRKSSTCQSSAVTPAGGTATADICVAEIPLSSGSYLAETNFQDFPGSNLDNDVNMTLDANQNVWVAAYEGGSGSSYSPLAVIPNTGTTGSPVYTANGSLSPTNTTEAFGMLAIDAAGNAWTGIANSIFYYTLTNPMSNTSTCLASSSPTCSLNGPSGASSGLSVSKPQSGEWDGGSGSTGLTNGADNGKIWFTYPNATNNVFYYSPSYHAAAYASSTYAEYITPCYLPGGTATCSLSLQYPHSLQIDSTGSIWVAASMSAFDAPTATPSGFVVQIFGGAAPTWPQLSYAHFGVEPQ